LRESGERRKPSGSAAGPSLACFSSYLFYTIFSILFPQRVSTSRKISFFLKKSLTFLLENDIVSKHSKIFTVYAGVAQLVEQLICNQQVRGSSPFTSSKGAVDRVLQLNMEEFPSGQRGQTVNLLLLASVVRIHPPPPD
jgi:hypothetical protein